MMQWISSGSPVVTLQLCRCSGLLAFLSLGLVAGLGGTAHAETTASPWMEAAALKPDVGTPVLSQKQEKPVAAVSGTQPVALPERTMPEGTIAHTRITSLAAPVASTVAVSAGAMAQTKATGPDAPVAPAQRVVPEGAIAQDVGLEESSPSIGPYVGLAVNVGIAEGSTDVGQGGGAVFSRIPLADPLSIRPAVLIGDDITFLIPVTLDASPFELFEDFTIAPYAGAGVAIATTDDDNFNALLTAGVDIPISQRWVGNIAANVTLINATDFGIQFGIAYRF